jgi:Domain of unknown function (DUF1996)
MRSRSVGGIFRGNARRAAPTSRPRTRAAALTLVTAMVLTTLAALAPTAQADNGQFHFFCGFAKRGRIDPIVSPRMRSMHRHDLYGNKSISKGSTYRSMLRGRSTCEVRADKSGYWHPVLVKNGRLIRPDRLSAYYWGGPTNNDVRPYPRNFRIIAGGNTKFLNRAGYNCGEGIPVSPVPLDCGGNNLKGVIIFPSCWNGKSIGLRNDHRSHMRYPVAGRCQGRYPITLPKLILHIRWPITDGRGARLVSDHHMGRDHGMSLHADFWNVWHQRALRRLVNRCINAGKICAPG